MEHTLNSQQQADNDALATAVGAAAQELGLDDVDDVVVHGNGHEHEHEHDGHVFHHTLQQPDFGQHLDKEEGEGEGEVEGEEEVDVAGIALTSDDVGDDFGLDLEDLDTGDDRPLFSRPPSIRKACDLCHAAKQKCSGDRPTCVRCHAGGWQCNYAPRQRRRTVPKSERSTSVRLQSEAPTAMLPPPVPQREMAPPPPPKKRKIDSSRSVSAFESTIDLKAAMAALDMGLTDEEGEEIQTMTDDQMLEVIAVDGYLADLPLSTFVNNLPYTAPSNDNPFNPDELSTDGFHAADIDQHTTSALRDAIFSLNESTKNHATSHPGNNGVEEEIDPHTALLDLSHAHAQAQAQAQAQAHAHSHSHSHSGDTGNGDTHDSDLLDLTIGCNHPSQVPHILALLLHHSLEPKPGYTTPLTLSVFAPLARSLRLFQLITDCPTCSTSPQQTLPQLALLSRTTTILTFAFPPINSSAVGGSAQITIHGARLAGTGISEAIEQHIVGVVWDSWRASVREIFALLDRKAQDVIQQSSPPEGLPVTSAETQRAGLFFQAMGRLVTAMDEVEGN